MKMSNDLVLVLLVIFVWGLWGFFIKVSVSRIGAYGALFWAFLTFAFFDISLAGIIFYTQKIPLTMSTGSFFAIFGAAFSVIGMFAWYFYIERTPISIAAPLTALYPAIAVILGYVILKETVTAYNLAGIILAIAAMFLLAL